MAKIRVYQLAKELGVDNAELIEKLKALNFEVKNHMSTLSEGEVERVRSEYIQKQEVKVDEVRIKPGIIRRRKKAAEKPAPVEEAGAPEPEVVAAETVQEAEEAPVAPTVPESMEGEAPAERRVGEPEGQEPAVLAEAKPGQAQLCDLALGSRHWNCHIDHHLKTWLQKRLSFDGHCAGPDRIGHKLH